MLQLACGNNGFTSATTAISKPRENYWMHRDPRPIANVISKVALPVRER